MSEDTAAPIALPVAPGPPAPRRAAAVLVPGLEFRVEESTQTRRRLRAEIPAEVFEDALQTRFRKIRRQARIPGFRKGKAPKALIEERFLDEALNPVCRDLLQRAAAQILGELGLIPLAPPEWTVKDAERGGPLRADMAFSVWPTLGEIAFDGIEVTAPKREVTEAEIGDTLDEIARQRARPGPVEGRGLQDADYVAGDLEEVELAGAEAPRATPDLKLQVGGGGYHPALHEALQGASVGDTVVATAAFGADSPDRERAGRTIRAQFTIREAATAVPPPIDDDLARAVGAASLLALRGDIRDRLKRRAARDDRNELESKLLAALLEKNPVEAPEPAVEAELEARLRLLGADLVRQGVDLENAGVDWERHANEMRPAVERSVRGMIALDALAKQQDLEPGDEEVEKRLGEIAEREGKTVAAIRGTILKEDRMDNLVARLRRERALRFLEERAEVKTT